MWTYRVNLATPHEYHYQPIRHEVKGELYDLLVQAIADLHTDVATPIVITKGKVRIDIWQFYRLEEHTRWHWRKGENSFLRRVVRLYERAADAPLTAPEQMRMF